MQYIGQTSGQLHIRINQHRSDSCKYSTTSTKHSQSTAEIQHFNQHQFSNTTIDIIQIVKNVSERLFLESSYMTYFNTIYPYGLNTERFNRSIKVYSTINNINDYNPIYTSLNHNLHKKTSRTKRGKSLNKHHVSKNTIHKQLNHLQKQYLKDFSWYLIRKSIFSIKKKNLLLYMNVFLSKSFSKHFSDIYFDIIMARANYLNL